MKQRVLYIAFFLLTALLHGDRYFESNALGMPVREIQEFRVDEFQYVLKVIEGEELQVKILLKDEEEYKKWELLFAEGSLVEETLYQLGEIRELRRYDAGRVLEEIFYEVGEPAELRTYSYENNELMDVVAVDGNNEVLYRDVYERSPAGRLRRIRRVSGDQNEVSAFTYSGSKLVQEWHGKNEEGILFRYHDGGQLAEETWEGLKVMLAEEVRTHEGRKEVVLEDNILGVVTTQYYDSEDRVEIERTLSEDDLVEHIRFEYDDTQLLQKTRITRSAKEDWRYQYDDSGEIVRETLYRNTWIVKVIEHTADSEYFEEIYREGVAALRVYFKDGKKVDEEFLGLPEGDR